MPASPAPAFFRINYHSAFGPHTAQVPTLAWEADPSFPIAGKFVTWDGGTVDADVMINDYVTALLPFYPSTVVFDNYIIFSQPTPSDDPLPVASNVFTALVGTATGAGWTKAVQLTMSVRSTNFGIAKYVFLDAASGDLFDPIRSPDASMTALLAIVSDTTRAFSAQDNGRPVTFIGLTKDLNDKLRKAYRMV